MDRAGLLAMVDVYLDALTAQVPSNLPTSGGLRFTENGQQLALGLGLWGTVRGCEPGGRRFADPVSGQVAYWGVVTEMDSPAILGLRLHVAGGLITEIETLVVRTACPIFRPETLVTPLPVYDQVVDPAQRSSRAELVRAANLYLDGIERDDADLIPVAAGCVRVENGVQTTRNPNSERPHGRLGVAEQVSLGYTGHIEAARGRRFSVVDEERGLVLCHFFFDHAGNVETVGGRVPFGYPNSMMVAEVFKVQSGQIQAIEALLDIFPYGMKSGWD
jgi:hypothetical protein